MGAWGHKSFENDDAMDWIGELETATDTAPIVQAFDEVLQAEDYLEAPAASVGIAAAEVVAALLGRPAADLPDEVSSWLVGKQPPKPGLVRKAQAVVKRVLEESELQELWAESEDSTKWQQEMEDLLHRLSVT